MNAQTDPDTNRRPARKAARQNQPGQTGPNRQRPRPTAGEAAEAAATALAPRSYTATLPYGLGTVRIPPPEHLALYGGILALGLFGIVDWPVALAIGIGHLLAENHHYKVLAQLGLVLEEA